MTARIPGVEMAALRGFPRERSPEARAHGGDRSPMVISEGGSPEARAEAWGRGAPYQKMA